MAARRLETRVRREQIAEAALRIIARRGVRALSIAAVAEKVGIVPAAIYRHFKGKDQVLAAVLALVRAKLLANVTAVCAESPEPLERLHLLLKRHISSIGAFVVMPRILLSEDALGSGAATKSKVHQMIMAYLGAVMSVIGEGQARGHIRRDIPADSVALMFLGVVQPAAMIRFLTEGKVAVDVNRHTEIAWRIFSDSIRARTRNRLQKKATPGEKTR